jgi:hypothetical protein
VGTQIGPWLMATLALSLASCGSDADEPPEREGPQVTKAHLIARGDAICRRDQARAGAQLTRLPRQKRSAPVEATLIPILEVNERAIRDGVRKIEALGRPATDSNVLDEYLDERVTAANTLRAAIAAARRDDSTELDAALKTYSRSQAQEAATKFGFKVCGLGAGRVER